MLKEFRLCPMKKELRDILSQHMSQIFWLLFSRKAVRRGTPSTQTPLMEPLGAIFVPGNIWALRRLCLQKIDLSSGRLQKQIFKGTGHGHSVICSKAGKGWLIPENGLSIIEFDLQTLRQTGIIILNGNLMGGHGECSSDGNRLYFVDRSTDDRNIESNLVIYDVNRKKVIDKFERIGIYAHDVKITKDEKTAIVVNYGRVTYFVGKMPKGISGQSLLIRKPSFTIIDLVNKAIKSKYVFEDTFILAHAQLDESGQLAFIQGTNVIPLRDCCKESLALIIRQRKEPLTIEEKAGGYIVTPATQIKVDMQTGRVLKRINHDFYRSQSIILSKRHNVICETFAVSKKVVLFDKESSGIKKEFSFSNINCSDPRGLALSADERFLFVSGRTNNIYCLDLLSQSKPLDQIIYSNNNTNSHITFFTKKK